MDEVTRIRQAYQRRDQQGKRGLYSCFRSDILYSIQRREAELFDLFKAEGISDLSGLEILDLGCGNGAIIRDFVRYGARPEHLHGLDLLPDRIEEAQGVNPNIDFRCGNAERLPYGDGQLDMVILFTVFTSILDPGMRRNIAAEVLRVLKPGGIIIWYDYHMNNPRNPDVRGVKKDEITNLFPGCRFRCRRTSLAPPLATILAPVSWILCTCLEMLRFLNTHYLCLIRKP
ncbi:MAG: class I SAM-dependent methyltransferase [Thermodesulfobacteriota bacterium]